MFHQNSLQRATAGVAIAALMIAGTVAVAQVVVDEDQGIIQIAPDEPAVEQQVRPQVRQQQALPEYWIGLAVGEIPDLLRKHLRIDGQQGVLVLSVIVDSPAAKAGVEKDDILLTAAGDNIAQPRQLVDVVGEFGDKPLELAVIHEGERKTVLVTPEKRPDDPRNQWRPQIPGGRHWQLQPGDRQNLQRWFQQIPQFDNNEFQFRAFGPGMQLNSDLPNGLKVQISKQGEGPAHLKVERDGKLWEFDSDDQEAIDKLPEDVKSAVQGMLNNGNGRFFFRANPEEAFRNSPDWLQKPLENVTPGKLEERMREMEKRMQKLIEQIEELGAE